MSKGRGAGRATGARRERLRPRKAQLEVLPGGGLLRRGAHAR